MNGNDFCPTSAVFGMEFLLMSRTLAPKLTENYYASALFILFAH